MMAAGDVLYAHHAALLAIPALVPAVVVVAVVLHIARQDRMAEREENELIDRAFEDDSTDQDTTDKNTTDHDTEKDT